MTTSGHSEGRPQAPSGGRRWTATPLGRVRYRTTKVLRVLLAAGALVLLRCLRLVELAGRALAPAAQAVAAAARPLGRAAAYVLGPLGQAVAAAARPLGRAVAWLCLPLARRMGSLGARVLRPALPVAHRMAKGLRSLSARAVGWVPAGVRQRAGQAGAAVGRHRRVAAAVTMVALAVVALSLVVPGVTPRGAPAYAAGARASGVSGMARLADLYGTKKMHFTQATTVPNPAPPSVAQAPPLQSHEVFGFAPYWTLTDSGSYNVADLTTLAYFSVDLNPDGTFNTAGNGWDGFESQSFTNLVNRAHAAGDRVVLTVTDFNQQSLNQLTSDPAAPGRLANALLTAVESKNLDGVNLDLEGQGSADQGGLTSLVETVAATLHAANPHYQVTMDTYASSAGDQSGFYNIAALSPWVDGFFVMQYKYNLQAAISAQSPITSSEFSDLQTLQEYTAVVPASKVIMGVPFYGEDWPTTNGTQGATSTGAPTALTEGDIRSSGHPVYWDPVTDTPWTSYKAGGQWRETYYEDPSSVYLETQLAQRFGVGGMGIWALGMDGNDPAMTAAILGNAPAAKDTLAGPTSTVPSVLVPRRSAPRLTLPATPRSLLPPLTTSPGATTKPPGATTTSPGATTTTKAPRSTTTTTTSPGTTTTTSPGTTTTTSPGTTTTSPPVTCQVQAPKSWPSQVVGVACYARSVTSPAPSPTVLYQSTLPAGGPPAGLVGGSLLEGVVLAPQPTDPVLACLTQFAQANKATALNLPVSVLPTTNASPTTFYVDVPFVLALMGNTDQDPACVSLAAQAPPVQWLVLTSTAPAPGPGSTTTEAPGAATTAPPQSTTTAPSASG